MSVLDGTLTMAGRPEPDTLAALDETRAAGRRVVIVTGRVLADLVAVFPDAARYADLIVAENGAVLARGARCRILAEPVPAELAAALAGRGVSCRLGQVLLACRGADELAVLEEVRRLGLECQLVRNRAELMVLPAGVSKGSGLAAGLVDLGISAHNAVAIGDAENDHSLLAAAELGVAVGNAVDALKADADIVLAEEDGAGVAAFLRGPVLAGREHVHSRRWRIALGELADGTPVSVPASQVNMLVTGVPQRGKSYVAGLIAERLFRLGYSLVVFDPEGDHGGLSDLGDVLVTGAGGGLPSVRDLARIVRHHRSGVVVGLSGLPPGQRGSYLDAAHREFGTGLIFSISDRETSHMRHWHKYAAGHLRPDRRFYFRRDWDTPTGVTAGSAEELQHELAACDEAVIVHHCRHGDFSRWIADVLGDPPLAALIAASETEVSTGTTTAAIGRTTLRAAIGNRRPRDL